MNDRINESDSDFATFKEWLEETAEREGSSPDSVLNHLMSTYWILTELSTVIEDTPYAEGDVVDEEESDAGGDHRAIIEVIESIAEMHKGQQSQAPALPSTAIDPGIIQLIEALQSKSAGTSESFAGSSAYRLEKLHDEVVALERDLRKVEEHSEDIDDTLGRNARNLARLRQDIAAIERTMEDGEGRAALGDFDEQIEEHLDALSKDLNETENRFETAYASIKQILEHLLATSERHDEKIGTLGEVLVDAFQDIGEGQRNTELLIDLKKEANELGIRTPTCDNCEHSIDLALLAEPRCPSCDRYISRFETSTGLLRKMYVAKTQSHRSNTATNDTVRMLQKRLDQIDASKGDSIDLGLDDTT